MAKKGRRGLPEINAGSMADIAFLLLIFFLVTTTMDMDKGILVTLPPISDEPPPDTKANQRNVMEILVNSRDDLLVEGKPTLVRELRQMTIDHVNNNGRDPEKSDTPKDAIVSLKNDKSTTYARYIEVYNEVKAAYNQLRNEESQRRFGADFDQLTVKEQKKEIAEAYPIKLSEAEPKDYSAEGQ